MAVLSTYLLFMVISACWAQQPSSSDNFPFSVDLSLSFRLSWKFNDTSITFKVLAATSGVVGLGVYHRAGSLRDADIAIGWVKNKTAYLHDCHGVRADGRPLVDDVGDVTLLGGSENGTHTTLTFSRPLAACKKHGVPITSSTMKVVYIYGMEDPPDIGQLKFDGSQNSGNRSVLLLDHYDDVHDLPTPLRTIEVINKNVELPADKKYLYWCHGYKLPRFLKKHHVIKIEPIITPGNEIYVQHIAIYPCVAGTPTDLFDNIGFDCATPWSTGKPEKEYQYLLNCSTEIMFGWSYGEKEAYYYPADYGYLLGGQDSPLVIRLETNFDNQKLRTGIIDNSGLKLTLTESPRTHNVGTMVTGQNVEAYVAIPPHFPALISRGVCPHTCLSKSVPAEGVTIVAFRPFMHLFGISLRVRLLRNGKEEPPIALEDNYDYNFHETRNLKTPVKVYPTDDIIVDCVYNSEKNDHVTFAGLETRTQEMCLALLTYHPRVNLGWCTSIPAPYTSLSVRKDLSMATKNTSSEGAFMQMMNPVNWKDQSLREEFQHSILTGDYKTRCLYHTPAKNTWVFEAFPKNLSNVPDPPKQICPKPKDKKGQSTALAQSNVVILFFLTIFIVTTL